MHHLHVCNIPSQMNVIWINAINYIDLYSHICNIPKIPEYYPSPVNDWRLLYGGFLE